ncbi:MAG: hypothetical protein LBI45_07180 [Bacteroidales bacterium]|jgi:hypothetical protein|nr:hypothetical protein [Bacteroidales bacterium]
MEKKKGLKIYKKVPKGWIVTNSFTMVKRGYIGIHNGKNPFAAKKEYKNGQIELKLLKKNQIIRYDRNIITRQEQKNPKIGQFVFDIHYKKKRKIMAVPKNENDLFFIGSEHEPVRRNEFIYPLPKK